MTRTIQLPAGDLELAARARPDLDEASLIREAIARGSGLVRSATEAAPSGEEELERALRVDLAHAVAEVAGLRWSIVSNRERLGRATDDERRTYEESIALDADLVPALKVEARDLRMELRRLEVEAAARGIDVGDVEPSIDWSSTIAVAGYGAPRYESAESRRATTVAFFRRIRPADD